jgi:hypothetical protein
MSTTEETNSEVLAGMTEKDIGLSELDGFQLPPAVVDRILVRMQEESRILGMVDTVQMNRLEEQVPTFGVPALSGDTRAEGGDRTAESSAESGDVKFNATDQIYYIHVDIKRDAIKNINPSPNAAGDMIVGEFVDRWSNDVALIGMRANASEGDLASYTGAGALDSTFDGWIAIAEGTADNSDRIGLEGPDNVTQMPTYDNQSDETSDSTDNPTDQPVDTEMFHKTIQTLPQRYRDPENVGFIMSPDQVQQYYYDLTGRNDNLGVAVLQGNSEVTPFEYDIVGIPGWPDQYAMFTNPDNLAYGLYDNMDVEQLRNTDKTAEQVLHSRTWFEGQFDYQVKNLMAGVLITGLKDPLSG